MKSGLRKLLLPVLGRHLRREFLRAFGLTLLAFVAIYVIAEFFDRFDDFLASKASTAAIARAFAYKLPLVVAQVAPLAVLAGALLGLSLLARGNEFVALRACGVSLWQILAPLALLALLLSVATFAWNETLVPVTMQRWHQVWNQEIKHRKAATIFTGREFWYRGEAGFYNVERIGVRRQTLFGLTVYQLGADFRPQRTIHVGSATWRENRWELNEVRTLDFGPDGVREYLGPPAAFTLPESFDDFRVVSVEPEEFSFRTLRMQIASLRAKGIDVSESLVDLHLKLALPAASLVLMLVAVPLVAQGTRVSGMTAALGFGFGLGFSYFILLAFCRALGQSGALPPLLAAWTANAVFALIGLYLLLGSE